MILDEQEIKLNLEIIKFLLEHGADRTLQCIEGKTAFEIVQEHQSRDKILDYLNNIKQIYFYDK